ncbi:STAS domain-containing protein [Xylanibacillus composti]|uniref:histidine kinase n=1 Tax=Xylanibacillus composti TaxID=1572762 RepID=A0A8J4H5X3_9BACL|nr:ATP-binding protein [Xylanibacillus composti]MDT9724036.1 STAS domain-containing protein [Xylanibacillus composti]GIQ69429.1 hypothetical protein XYCOK13_22530 [Xylanibacillus composti]
MVQSDSWERTNKSDTHLSQLASVGQIAAGIAHEVKNPLTAVKGFLQLLKQKNDEQYIEIAQAELENAIAILQNLLHVSKPDLDDEPFESIDLAAELELLTQLFQDQFYRVSLVKEFEHTGSYIYGKKNQLKKVFFNLIKNAFEAIPENGSITIRHTADKERVMITIEDNGVGIPANKLEMLGTPFYTTKQSGTGMGLTLVFSVVYQHNGSIHVESEEHVGTKFTITFPREIGRIKRKEVVKLDLIDHSSPNIENLTDFFTLNRAAFEKRLLAEAINVRDKIDEIMEVGNINLLDNAHRLVLLVVEGREHEVISFAKTEGIVWAKHSLTLAFKLEWIQAVRRVLWDFLYNYDLSDEKVNSRENFFNLEKQINSLMDLFLNHLFISYSQFKDDLIRAQREMVEDLSVPIIPLSRSTSILPLIGPIDALRSSTIEEKVFSKISNDRIETLIIDLSGTLEMEPEVIQQLIGVIEGSKMMGCEVVITGLRPEIVKIMVRLGLNFGNNAVTKGTLQQALAVYIQPEHLQSKPE